ncbi:uncharacterized protein LOC130523588 [Takifugu flavidus]|nr:uncharacterized protein LOC130523588 [Takifugu flavidus]
MADSHSKDSLQSFVSYALSFQEIQALLTYEARRGDGVTASSEDDQLVGFGARAKSRWKEIWDSRGDGYADFVIGRRCVPGTRMSRLQQNLLKRQQPTTSSTPAEHPMKAPAEPLAMEEDVEMEREMLSIHNSDLQVQSYAMPVAAAALPTPLTQDSIEKIVQGILEMEQQQQRPEQKMRQTKPVWPVDSPSLRMGRVDLPSTFSISRVLFATSTAQGRCIRLMLLRDSLTPECPLNNLPRQSFSRGSWRPPKSVWRKKLGDRDPTPSHLIASAGSAI